LPFPTAVISATIQRGETADERTAVALYALVGVLLTISWLIFFFYLSSHPELTENGLEAGYFREDCKRASAGVFLYAWAGCSGMYSLRTSRSRSSLHCPSSTASP